MCRAGGALGHNVNKQGFFSFNTHINMYKDTSAIQLDGNLSGNFLISGVRKET